MEIFLSDPSDIPLPPADIRILEVRATPWSDGRRIKVNIDITPFQKQPNIDISIRKPSEVAVLSETTIIGIASKSLEFTVHLRVPSQTGELMLTVVLYYNSDLDENETGERSPPQAITSSVIDQKQIAFSIS